MRLLKINTASSYIAIIVIIFTPLVASAIPCNMCQPNLHAAISAIEATYASDLENCNAYFGPMRDFCMIEREAKYNNGWETAGDNYWDCALNCT